MKKLNDILSNMSTTQKVAFGILCAVEVYKDKDYIQWADKWLSGKDRTNAGAIAAADADIASAVIITTITDATTIAAASAVLNKISKKVLESKTTWKRSKK